MQIARSLIPSLLVLLFAAADWPQWGGSPARSASPAGKNIPVEWNVGQFEPKTGRWLGNAGPQHSLGCPARLDDLRLTGHRRRQSLLCHQ